jgi:hypothetical protein
LEERFSVLVKIVSGAHSVSYTMGTRSFPEEKQLWSGVNIQYASNAEVKERVEIFPYTFSAPSWHVLG